MRSLFVGRWLPGFRTFTQSMLSLMDITQEAQHRAKIITFWKKHGLEATKDAFGASRSTLFAWQRLLREGKGKLSSLESKSRRPLSVREMTTSTGVIELICFLRRAFPHYGPKKISKIMERDYKVVIGHCTVYKTIKRFNLPSAPRLHVAKQKQRAKKNRLGKDFKAKQPGDLVAMDTIVIQENGQKKYIITAVDIATRLALAWAYKRHSSASAADLLKKMQILLGNPIQKVITDNGSEFHGDYEKCCKRLEIEHNWTYPRSPKMNPHCERFNRTIQEEAQFPMFFSPIEEWNAWIAHFIMQYNCHRPHVSLEYKCPLERYLELQAKTSHESEMYVGHTGSVQPHSKSVEWHGCPLASAPFGSTSSMLYSTSSSSWQS